MSQDLDRHRIPGEPSAPRSTDAPRWPVLAQLPRVGPAPTPPPERMPTFTPAEPPREDASHVSSHSSEPDARRRRFVVDQPHRTASGAASQPEVTSTVAEPESVASASATTPGARRYRIDQPTSFHPAARPASLAHEPTTISGSIFRLHAALAPHLSLVGAVTLVVCGSVLYWIAISRNGGPVDPHRLIEFDNGWSREAPPQSEAPKKTVKAAATPTIDSPPINWTAPPHVADATAATPEPEAPAKSSAEAAPAADNPAPTVEQPADPPAAAAPVATTPQPPTSMNELASTEPSAPATQVTPTPQIEPYPTTPYPAFSFADPAFVAERPTTSPTGLDTPH